MVDFTVQRIGRWQLIFKGVLKDTCCEYGGLRYILGLVMFGFALKQRGNSFLELWDWRPQNLCWRVISCQVRVLIKKMYRRSGLVWPVSWFRDSSFLLAPLQRSGSSSNSRALSEPELLFLSQLLSAHVSSSQYWWVSTIIVSKRKSVFVFFLQFDLMSHIVKLPLITSDSHLKLEVLNAIIAVLQFENVNNISTLEMIAAIDLFWFRHVFNIFRLIPTRSRPGPSLSRERFSKDLLS